MKQKYIAFIFLYTLTVCFGHAQVLQDNMKLNESKTFAKNTIRVIQSQYLNSEGFPSHEMFIRKNGLYKENIKIQSTPFFKVSVLEKEIAFVNGKLRIGKNARLLNLDFFVETVSKYNSLNIANYIFDGRVYEDGASLIVGGYSSKFNERPVGRINDKGLFVPEISGKDSKSFSILQIPPNQIIFDPFEWTLLQIEPSLGKMIQSQTDSFLPINIYGEQSNLLNNLSFELIDVGENSSLVLYGYLDGKKFEIANCSLVNSSIVNKIEGFQPQMNEEENHNKENKIVTLTFKGKYSSNIIKNGTELYLNDDIKFINERFKTSANKIRIDGSLNDWKNIRGVSDIKGDYVSYLYANPDTDLLEFKVTNDDKYLYFYSRVSGAHGRTGAKGRYYWYTYIDVDNDAHTGYPPTRDDNCYFGISIGDDSEVQFEFIGNKFIKTFFGFTGIGAEKEVLSGKLQLGPSYYSSTGSDGKKRNKYKIEYVNINDSLYITHDYTPGNSENITIALSPDGSEVEVKAELTGFLKDKSGVNILYPGKIINIAVGTEGSSDHYGSERWGADSSPIIYGYKIK